MHRVYNFAAGPAQLPEQVLQQVGEELLDWHNTGMSMMEIPHRGQEFESLAQEAAQDLRDLLTIPAHYQILFLPGGGRTQFSMVPMNLAANAVSMAYVETGIWSQFALEEARRYGNVHVAASGAPHNFTDIPPAKDWDIPSAAAYLHYTDNETIHGVEFPAPPACGDIALVSDMSSNLLSKPLEIERFGLIYACAQKNLGPAGITVVIIRDDLVRREPMSFTPSMYRYALHAENNSLYNTPPTFNWYVMGLIFKWVKKQGGIAKMAEINRRKAAKLYEYIDQSNFYRNPVKPAFRSNMNVPFILADENLNKTFLVEAEKAGLANLKGHRLVGGMRASLYNAMPESGVEALIDFMREFVRSRT